MDVGLVRMAIPIGPRRGGVYDIIADLNQSLGQSRVEIVAEFLVRRLVAGHIEHVKINSVDRDFTRFPLTKMITHKEFSGGNDKHVFGYC